MNDAHDILDEYLQMRQSNAAREQADMSLIKQLRNDLRKAEQTIHEQQEKIRQLEATIRMMKEVQPVNNTYNVHHDYVAQQNIQIS